VSTENHVAKYSAGWRRAPYVLATINDSCNFIKRLRLCLRQPLGHARMGEGKCSEFDLFPQRF
jgi:hypothetical protein